MRPTVIICPGPSAHRDWGFFPELAARLARAGLAVVSFDLSGDLSDSTVEAARPTTELQDPERELELVLEAVRRGTVGLAVETYGLIGHDTGGALALLRSAADDRVRALVTWGAMARLGDGSAAPDILSAARAVRVPWLLVHGTADQSVPMKDALALRHAAQGDSVELLFVEGSKHTFGAQDPWTGSNPALDQVVRASVAWLVRHLL